MKVLLISNLFPNSAEPTRGIYTYQIVKELEKEGVGVRTTNDPPPMPIIIAPEKQRLEYDIEIPQTDFSYVRFLKDIRCLFFCRLLNYHGWCLRE